MVENDLNKIRSLLEGGVNPSLLDSEQMTPLHFAVDRGYLEAVQLLIRYGGNINQINNEGQTPLMIAITCQHLVRSLLLFYIFISSLIVILPSSSVYCSLFSVSLIKEIIKELLNSNGIELDIRDHEGLTAKEMAQECDNLEIQDLFK